MAKKELEATQNANEAKLMALKAAMSKIEKDFGKGSIMKLGEQQFDKVDVIPSGSLGLDIALGVGGYPKGRIIEIYGPESSGKTTLAIHAIAEAQKLGGMAAIIDAEHAFDRFYAASLGVDVDNLLISQTSKVILKLLQARLQQYMNHELPDVQAGFRKGRGTRNQIANIHWVIEKEREFQKNICFIDYAKAFDCRSQQTGKF